MKVWRGERVLVEEQVLNSYVIYLSEKIFLGQVLPATVVLESNRIKDALPGRVEVPGALLNMHRVSKTASTRRSSALRPTSFGEESRCC